MRILLFILVTVLFGCIGRDDAKPQPKKSVTGQFFISIPLPLGDTIDISRLKFHNLNIGGENADTFNAAVCILLHCDSIIHIQATDGYLLRTERGTKMGGRGYGGGISVIELGGELNIYGWQKNDPNGSDSGFVDIEDIDPDYFKKLREIQRYTTPARIDTFQYEKSL
jgi:hypothetical protein